MLKISFKYAKIKVCACNLKQAYFEIKPERSALTMPDIKKPRPKIKVDLSADVIKDIEKKAVETVSLKKEEIHEKENKTVQKEEQLVNKHKPITERITQNVKEDIKIEVETKEEVSTIIEEKKKEEVPKETAQTFDEEIKGGIEKENIIEEVELEEEPEMLDADDFGMEDPLMPLMGVSEDINIITEQSGEVAKIKAEELNPHIDLNEKELKKYARKKLKEISIDESMETTLYPLIAKSVRGFRCTFLGAMGTAKEDSLEEIAQLLYDIGKVESPKCTWIGFSEIPKKFDTKKVYVIDDLQSAISYLFNLEDFSENASEQQKHYQDLMEQLINAPRNAYIFLNSKVAEYKGFLPLDSRLTFIFDNQVVFPDLTNEEIYQKFKALIPDTHIDQINKKFEKDFIKYLDRNRRFFPFENAELATFLSDYAVREDEIKLPKEKYNPATLEQTFSKIIGMDNVKDQVRELNQYLSVRQDLKKAGANLPAFNMHMMFLGNPGVGKTTIARVIAKVLFDLGYCREEKLIEVTSKDLVGAYGNQTGIKTNRVIMRALGGVLFVDEAYSLSNSCGQAGAEAISIIIKAMIDYQDDLVVMFAGYNVEMRSFIESNSGISSRINYIFKFEDYTPNELYNIFKIKLKSIGMVLEPDAEEPVRKLCKFASGRKNAGNGRFIDNLIQKALTKHALMEHTNDNILVLTKESIPSVEDIMKTIL